MSDVLDEGSGGRVDPTSSLFQREWQTYRKMVDNNYLFHREAYGRLRELLLAEVARPFRFLDIACGDASATAGALAGTPIAHYAGIDLSIPALEIARSTLTTLSCPITLHHRDFCEALREWSEPADIVWIGLSLHHLHAREKCSVMRDVRRILRDDGILLIYENTSPNGEERPAWLRRWDDQQPSWTAFTKDEWDAVRSHVWAADYPETISRWRALGRSAGFRSARQLFVAPTNLFRMWRFSV